MDSSGLIYSPDPTTSFMIKLSCGISTTGAQAQQGSPFTGLLNLIVRFGPGVTLQNIMFWGTGELANPKAPVSAADVPDVKEKIKSINKSEEQNHKDDMKEVEDSSDGIMAKLGMSLDFDEGSFHAYAEVKIDIADSKITGKGQLDLLINPGANKWHLYIGGYDNPEILVPSFHDPGNEIRLYPVTVGLNLSGLPVVAKTYFLMGNDIEEPPNLDAEAASSDSKLRGCKSRLWYRHCFWGQFGSNLETED